MDPIQVNIRGYQSIDSLDFTIRGFTCITGKTNIGKSAIMRAISSSILNNPVVGMVRKGCQFATVDIQSATGWGFRWEKGAKGINRYTIQGELYDKVGQVQLPQIEQMGFGSVRIGDHDIQPWLATQFSPIFLLDKSATQITAFISEVSKLHVLQDAIVLSARSKRKETDSAREKSEELKKTQDQLSVFAEVDNLEEFWNEIAAQKDSILEYEIRIERMKRFEREIRVSSDVVSHLGSISTIHPPKLPNAEDVRNLGLRHELWLKLEYLAKRIHTMRQGKDALIPNVPVDDLDRILQMAKFSHLSRLAHVVSRAREVETLKIPAVLTEHSELAKIGRAWEVAQKITSSQARVAKLSVKIEVPEPPRIEDFDKLREMAERNQKMMLLAQKITQLRREIADCESKRQAIETKLKSIPTCPTCNQPYFAPQNGHVHAAGVSP